MAINLPQKPRSGFHAIQELTRAVNGVIDYIASFLFSGDGIIKVNHSMFNVMIGLDIDELKKHLEETGLELENTYRGMFKLTSEDDDQLDIAGGSVCVDGDIYEVSGTQYSISGTMYIYVVKTENGYQITRTNRELGYSSAMPAVLIGKVDNSGVKPEIIQEHYGAIHIDSCYKGMFSTEVYMSGDNYYCYTRGGTAYANATAFQLNDTSTVQISTGETYVYFSVVYDTSDGTFQNGKIDYYGSRRSSETNTQYLLLATIKRTQNGVSVEQNHIGEIQVFFWGDCQHDDED